LLRLISYLAPSIPADFFRAVASHIEATCGVATDLAFEERISGPLTGDHDPFADATVDVGFICAPSYRWMRAKDAAAVELLPAPVPLDVRANGRPIYFADVVVRADAGFITFDDLRGSRWAYNDQNSRSGWFSMVERVKNPEEFFGSLTQSGSHLRSLELVLAGDIDASAIDSNALALQRIARPELDDALRVVETWGPYAIQPVIVRGGIDRELKARIAAALLAMTPESLAPFGFRGFAPVDDSAY
jgi:phosphonate transport system substrate-binding protein